MVKYYVYNLPYSATPVTYNIKMDVRSLNEFFHPLILIKHDSDLNSPKTVTEADFPNISSQDVSQKIGASIIGEGTGVEQTVSNLFSMSQEYSFTQENQGYGFLAITMYSFVYGLTDLKKPVFYISVSSDNAETSAEPDWSLVLP